MEIFFDFTENATRQSILKQLLALFDDDARAEYERECAKVCVPDKHHHNLMEIYKTIDALDVGDGVRSSMISIYDILASAEAYVHNSTPENVHFHEVGRAEGIQNVANICIAFDILSPEVVRATPVQAGQGKVECAHGEMDIPSPATAAILDGCVLDKSIPTVECRLEGEFCTPTSTAIIKHFVDEFCSDGIDVANVKYFHGHVSDHAHPHKTNPGLNTVSEFGDNHAENCEVDHVDVHEKLRKLKDLLQDCGSDADLVTIAFSGGVDSTFLLDVAYETLGDKVLALTASSAVYPESEEDFAIDFCKTRGIKHKILNFDIFDADGFAENSPERCYFCKRALLTQLLDVALEEAIATHPRVILMDGTNATDVLDIRPGERAVREAGVVSPLMDAGLAKADIRVLSRDRNLITWDKPSFACLASRVAFGDEITSEILDRVDAAERMLRRLGFEQVRVRAHEKGRLARIEVEPSDILRLTQILCESDRSRDNASSDARPVEDCVGEKMTDITRVLHDLGFKHVSVDVDGYRTGSMNY